MPSKDRSYLEESLPALGRYQLMWSLGVLTLVSFLNYMDRMVLAVLLHPIGLELHLNDTQLGLLSGLAFAALYATLGIPLARMADRRSRVRLLAVCLALWSAMTAVTGLSRSFGQLFLARIGVGIGEAGCVPAAHSLIGSYFSSRQRPMAVSVFQAGALAGVSAGLLLTGLLADHFGWRAALIILGVSGLPAVLLVLTLKEPVRSAATAFAESTGATIRGLLSRRAFVHLAIAIAIGGFANYGIAQWAPSFYVRSFGLSLSQVGLYVGAAAAIGGIGGVITGGLVAEHLIARDERWEIWLPGMVYALAAPLYAITFLSTTFEIALASSLAANFAVSAGGGVALSSIQSLAEVNRRAMAVAMVLFLSSFLGLGLGPLCVGLLSDALQPAFGQESLRYALLASTSTLLWASTHFALSSRSYTFDRGNM